jgi:BirA family biotin operon repressor/biotin-[acetyl-CoA-carboxylase] ligase
MTRELLAKSRIYTELSDTARALLADIHIFQTLPSTNTFLMQQARRNNLLSGSVCLAETQTAGRGRHGRHWVSPPGANLYLSLLWHFRLPLSRTGVLSLAAGVAVSRALQLTGAENTGVKWPNDIIWQDRKLAGILIELSKIDDASCFAVIGVGINVHMPADIMIDQPWIDLGSILEDNHQISRNRLTARVLNQLLPTLAVFHQTPAASIIRDWHEFDLFKDRNVVVRLADKNFYGVARGVAEDGSLLLETQSGINRYAAGEISLRPA